MGAKSASGVEAYGARRKEHTCLRRQVHSDCAGSTMHAAHRDMQRQRLRAATTAHRIDNTREKRRRKGVVAYGSSSSARVRNTGSGDGKGTSDGYQRKAPEEWEEAQWRANDLPNLATQKICPIVCITHERLPRGPSFIHSTLSCKRTHESNL